MAFQVLRSSSSENMPRFSISRCTPSFMSIWITSFSSGSRSTPRTTSCSTRVIGSRAGAGEEELLEELGPPAPGVVT